MQLIFSGVNIPAMSCATNPTLCQQAEYRLRGPLAQPPAKGWHIIELPWQAAHLQRDWMLLPPQRIGSSKAAWGELMDFLQANNIRVPFTQIREESLRQWCEPEPRRCPKYKEAKLPWARARWEWANRLLVNPADPKAALEEIVADLTERINGPEGCVLCASHWAEVLAANPIPEAPTLEEARQWLVDRHNDSREGKTPTPFAEVAAKFNWT